MAANKNPAHDDQEMVDEHVASLAVHEEKLNRTDKRLEEHDIDLRELRTGFITIRADIKASRYILGSLVGLVGVIITVMQRVWP